MDKNNFLQKYYLTLMFTVLALVFSWSLIHDLTKYVFFVAFNFLLALSYELLVKQAYQLGSKSYNLTKGLLALLQLIFSSIILYFLSN